MLRPQLAFYLCMHRVTERGMVGWMVGERDMGEGEGKRERWGGRERGREEGREKASESALVSFSYENSSSVRLRLHAITLLLPLQSC